MSPIRSVVLALGFVPLACAYPALAQDTIEEQMTPEQFRSAGLHKLSTEELAQLNGWLNRTITTETAKAATQARNKVEEDNRGFFDFGRADPIVSSIKGEFRGFQKGRNYVLANGQEWEQTDEASLVGVRKTDPKVRISPSRVGNAWYLKLDDYSTHAKVRRVK